MTWGVLLSDNAKRDLREIRDYIANDLRVPETAGELIVRILKAAHSLAFMPFRHRIYETEPWHSIGVRVLPVDKYLILYLPDETKKTVEIIRVVYGRRNMENI